MNNSFLQQFSKNIKFKYFCFDRVIIRGYILFLFFPAGVVRLLRALGFTRLPNGVMRILTDQLNAHIQKIARNNDIPIHWWPSEGGGADGAKSKFVTEKYANGFTGKGNHAFCILTDKEPVRTFVCRQLTSKSGKRYDQIYNCRKPVKQYYIYFQDALLGGPCYLKISSYPPAAHILRAIGSSYSSQRNHRSSLLERQALRAGLPFHAEFYWVQLLSSPTISPAIYLLSP